MRAFGERFLVVALFVVTASVGLSAGVLTSPEFIDGPCGGVGDCWAKDCHPCDDIGTAGCEDPVCCDLGDFDVEYCWGCEWSWPWATAWDVDVFDTQTPEIWYCQTTCISGTVKICREPELDETASPEPQSSNIPEAHSSHPR